MKKGLGRPVVGFDPLDQYFDTRPAQQADIGPGTAFAIDQATRSAILKAIAGVRFDVGFDAAAGQKAGKMIFAENHLGSDRAGAAAVERDYSRQGRRTVQKRRPQGWTGVVRHAEEGPI